jgi:hypothetical protein
MNPLSLYGAVSVVYMVWRVTSIAVEMPTPKTEAKTNGEGRGIFFLLLRLVLL